MLTRTPTMMMKMIMWYSVKTTTHQPLSKQLQYRILQLKRPRTRQTPKMATMIDLASPLFSKTQMVVLETPLSRTLVQPMAVLIMAMALHNKTCNNTTMIVLITVVVMIAAIVDTKVVKTMVVVAIIITDAMTTEDTVVIDAKTTNMEMIVAVAMVAATGTIDVVDTTTETVEVAQATMIKVATEAMVSRIEVPEETIIVNNSHMISSIETKLTLTLIIDFTTRTILISSVEPLIKRKRPSISKFTCSKAVQERLPKIAPLSTKEKKRLK